MSSQASAPPIPTHMMWLASGSTRWVAAHPARHLAEAEDRVLWELVQAASDMGLEWLTVQEPTGGRVLDERAEDLRSCGVQVLRRSTSDPHGRIVAPEGATLCVLVESPSSGHEELAGAFRCLAALPEGTEEVTEASISACLGVPDVDLVVRTGGVHRVPDLLLWQVAYSEIVVLDDLWPDVGRHQLDCAVAEYQHRDRRYGRARDVAMTFTKLTVAAGAVVLGVLCWLAAIGVTAVTEVLVTLFVLVVLIAGGNLLAGRNPHGR